MTASASSPAPTRFALREKWGEPDEWEGNVNDPRTREEHGIRWNEKWIWCLPDGATRNVYWHRYDFRGALRVQPDGTVEVEKV